MPKCDIKLLILCLLAFASISLSASVWEWRHISIDDGLLSNHVHSVDVDDDGIIWLGTRYGIISFDGNTVVPHLPLSAHTSPIMYNDILSVVPMRDGKIYFVTSLVFGVYDKHFDKFTPITIDGTDGLVTLCRIGDDELIVCCANKLVVYNTATSVFCELPADGINGLWDVAAMYQDRMGQVWIGTGGQGLFRYSSHERKMYRASDLANIKCIYQDSSGRILVGTWDAGLYLVNNPYSMGKCDLTRVAPSVLTDSVPVFSVVESVNDRQLWIGTDGGLLALDIDSFAEKEMKHSLKAGRVTALWADNSDIIWANTTESGVFFLDTAPGVFDSGKTGRPALPNNWGNTLSVFEDSHGTVWTGCLTYPILRNTRGSSKWDAPYSEFGHGRNDMPAVFTVGEDSIGNLYFGSCGAGLVKIDYDTGHSVSMSPSDSEALPDGRVMRIFTDSHGNVWLGTMSGFGVLLSDGTQRTISTYGDVMNICEKDGTVYVATLNDGIFAIDIDGDAPVADKVSNSRVTLDDGFQPVILSMASSPSRNIVYVGTEDEGLWTYDTSTGEYALTDLVPYHCNLQVANIHEDRHGRVWIATNRGLYRVNPDDTSDRVRYTVYDGLDNDYFIYNGMATDSLLYLPTHKGIEIIDIESTYAETVRQSPVRFGFTVMHFNNRRFEELSAKDRETISGSGLPIYSQKLTIPYNLNNFSIDFAAFDYRNPDLVAFSYMLDGYDDGWQQSPDGRRSATYTNLPSGNYKFRLRAGTDNGRWDGEEKVLRLRILPPWYLSWVALIAYVIIGCLLIFLFVKVVRRREREKARLQLMRKERESLEELNRTKLRFFTNVTHELLTPLTVISASISELRNGHGDSSSLCRIADMNVSKLVRLLQQILEFRKVETDNIKLRVSFGDIGVFVANTIEALRPLTLKKSMRLDLRLPAERIMGYFDSDKLDKILYNLVSNAAKYSEDSGVITVDVAPSADWRSLTLRVSDTGGGIPKSKQVNLFRRFYDGDYREHNTTGTGIGLSLTKDLVELSHGIIEVESEEGQGTSFVVTLPIAKDAFAPDEIGCRSDDLGGESCVDTTSEESVVELGDNSAEASAQAGRKPVVLVIEDNEDLLVLMKQVLGRTYDVVTESDGQAGLDTALREVPDLVITDLTMPGIDGLEIIRKLRADERTSAIPIIVLTARRQNDDRKESYEAGADVYLPKPFDPEMLRACIATRINSRRSQDDNGRLVIDLTRFDYEPADMQFLKTATSVVEQNLDKAEFDIPTFAKEVGISQTHLFRKLKELTGMSPTHFIRTTRLRAAARILDQHPDIRIGELAFMVGFSDARYFGICFKKEFGVTPVEYKSSGRQTTEI